MIQYRNNLPQLSDDLFLTDGGLETTLIFHKGWELPHFAAFDLLKHDKGQKAIREYFHQYLAIALENKIGFILESPTWRSSEDWGQRLGYSVDQLAQANANSIQLMREVRDEYQNQKTKIVISGCIGPRGDGYDPKFRMSSDEAERYHSVQASQFKNSHADMITAITMNYVEEAIGITKAAKANGMPVAISFTVETDGRLPTGQTLRDAIEQVDQATQNAPAYYMLNCAHPSHFEDILLSGESWSKRIKGLRANASRKSHAELNESETLDEGNPQELGLQYKEIRKSMSHLNVLGGCCGTDHRHIGEICKACLN
ncbi:homocysteine S-methyltransferase family protein [Leptospira sp. WS92.C1]